MTIHKILKKTLELKDLCFRFAKDKPFFFKDLSIVFDSKTINFVRGKNGAGKSTLFRLLQGNITQQEQVAGSIQISDTSYQLETHDHIDGVRLVHQKFDSMLADQFSFDDNMRFAGIARYPKLASLPDCAPLPDFLQRFGIDHTKPVKLLSGGQRQILAILMVLQKPTKVLLLDEPTAALDEQNTNMVMEFLAELVRTTDVIIIMICHDKELVLRYARDGYCELRVDQDTGLRSIEKIN